MPLAETVSIDGGALAAILAVLLAGALTWLTMAILGFRWAVKAARGSERARVAWGIAAFVAILPGLFGPNPFILVGLIVVAAQAVVFWSIRK